MKKKLFLIALLSLLTFTLAACSGAPIVYTDDYDMNRGVLSFDPKEIEFTVASYNIQGSFLSAEKTASIRALLSDNNVAIAGLQEMDQLSKRSGKTDYMSLFQTAPYPFGFFTPTNTALMKDTYGVAVLSATEFNETASFLLPYPYKTENRNIEKRVVTRTLTVIDGVQIALYNTHLSFEEIILSGGKSLRQAQCEYILSLMEQDPVPYRILTGDFNIATYAELTVFTDAGYACVNNADTKLKTYPSDDCFNGLDNVVSSANLTVVGCSVPQADYSDHYPLIVRLKTVI